MSDYTPEQAKVVEEILRIKHTEYYKVLKVDKAATDVEIKKSYRKLAIKLHPDKNKHPKASDAFKVIAKAFEVLGDESKRKMYDMTGSDPDSRGGMSGGAGPGAGAGFSNFQGFQGFQGFPQGAGMGGNLNEDLFDMLFGGGLGGNGFSFQFGGNGFSPNGRFYSNTPGMNARRRAAQQQQQQQQRQRRGANASAERATPTWASTAIQFLPLIIIIFSMLLNYIGGDSTSGRETKQFHGRVPVYQFQESSYYNVERTTPKYNVNYYIDERTMNDFNGRKDADAELKGLDKYVETKYVQQLHSGCNREKNYKRELIENAQGIFFNDWETIEKAQSMQMPHCEKLEELNLL